MTAWREGGGGRDSETESYNINSSCRVVQGIKGIGKGGLIEELDRGKEGGSKKDWQKTHTVISSIETTKVGRIQRRSRGGIQMRVGTRYWGRASSTYKNLGAIRRPGEKGHKEGKKTHETKKGQFPGLKVVKGVKVLVSEIYRDKEELSIITQGGTEKRKGLGDPLLGPRLAGRKDLSVTISC